MKRTTPAMSVTVIGGGNLGSAIVRGLVGAACVLPANLVVTRRRAEALREFTELGVGVTVDNVAACRKSRMILLCVQPKQVRGVLEEIAPVLTAQHIVISTATGVSIADMQAALLHKGKPARAKVFRAMPNTAITVQESMTCVCAPADASRAEVDEVLGLFGHLGRSLLIQEEQMASATVLAACGVAFAMRYIRACSQGGIEVGFDSHIAQAIATQTVKGAAALLQSGERHPEGEIDRVTTPRGCTIAGLNEMEHQGFSSALIKGITTSYAKISRIAQDAAARND